MNKKLLKQLVVTSYKNNVLDPEIVTQIADKLNKRELKQYIKALKNAERQRSVFVETPFTNQKFIEDNLREIFPSKKIVVKNDPSLLLGARISYVDDIFNMNLKYSLESIVKTIEQDYD